MKMKDNIPREERFNYMRWKGKIICTKDSHFDVIFLRGSYYGLLTIMQKSGRFLEHDILLWTTLLAPHLLTFLGQICIIKKMIKLLVWDSCLASLEQQVLFENSIANARRVWRTIFWLAFVFFIDPIFRQILKVLSPLQVMHVVFSVPTIFVASAQTYDTC